MSRNWLFAVVGLGAASALALAASAERSRKRLQSRREFGAELGKWEGEGGNVPQVPTVAPTQSPPSSVPPHLRH